VVKRFKGRYQRRCGPLRKRLLEALSIKSRPRYDACDDTIARNLKDAWMPIPTPVPVVLAGVHGHGRWHLRNLDRLRGAEVPVRLAGICDPRPPAEDERHLIGDVPVAARLDDLLDAVRPEITIVCTPIHTHYDLTLTAAAAGSHVLLEKPPTSTLAGFQRLVSGIAASGRACQVAFQSLGSQAIPYVRGLMADDAVGRIIGIGAAGTWQRDSSYYARAPWAGRRTLGGVAVVDGALTNPFAHATATALALDGDTGQEGLREVRVELFRANPIEADDTSCLRLVTARGTTITVAATLCAERDAEPYIVVHGTRGRIVLEYRTGRVRLEAGGRVETTEHAATDLLENLVAHVREPEVPLLVPLLATRSFMQVLEAVRIAPEPLEIPPEHRRIDTSGPHPRLMVPGIDDVVARSAAELALFSELDQPWARRATVAHG
jgi:predicted dehydrogenase